MARIVIPEAVIRTTSDGDGYPHGIAVGEGDSPDEALLDLKAEARKVVAEMSAERDLEDEFPEPGDWEIEVVDVRLVPALAPVPGRPAVMQWTAYGTLRTTRLSPLIPQE